MSAHQDLLAKAYDAFNARDLPGIRALMHPDGVWPDTLEAGELHGREAVMAHFAHVFALLRPNIQLIRVVDETTDSLTLEAQYLVQDLQGGIWSDTRASFIYHFRDGLLAGMTVLSGF